MGKLYRYSKQKDVILKVLKGTTCHPDADWVYEQVRQELPRVSLGTVYRNLRLLKESGMVHELGTPGNMNHFDGNIEPHYHFRCHRCGGIFDLDMEVNKTLEETVTQETGFKVTEHNLEFGGLCLSCQQK
jgi:Fur family transcriptional regulator, peroxide stress response regulator